MGRAQDLKRRSASGMKTAIKIRLEAELAPRTKLRTRLTTKRDK
jgi:hypothetical protein